MHSYCLSATDLGDDKDVLGREAHLARVGEIAWAMTDAGIVLVAALGDVDRFDLDRLRRLAAPHEVYVVGIDAGGELGADLELPPAATADEAAEEALRALAAAGVLPAAGLTPPTRCVTTRRGRRRDGARTRPSGRSTSPARYYAWSGRFLTRCGSMTRTGQQGPSELAA